MCLPQNIPLRRDVLFKYPGVEIFLGNNFRITYGIGIFISLFSIQTKPNMIHSVKKRFAAKKRTLAATLFVAGIIVGGIASCKAPESCEAYQGSGKSTRSHKHGKGRHSAVIAAHPKLS
jgi:hypothetical protein